VKVYIIFKDGTDEEVNVLPGNCSAAEAVELAKVFVVSHQKRKLEDVKSFEVEEDFL
jgi:hypothetical protein